MHEPRASTWEMLVPEDALHVSWNRILVTCRGGLQSPTAGLVQRGYGHSCRSAALLQLTALPSSLGQSHHLPRTWARSFGEKW